MKLIHAPWLFKILPYEAMVLYPFLLYKTKPIDPVTLNHERIHFDQIKRDTLIGFYLVYVYEYLLNRLNGLSHYESYFSISYEIEAYENQHNPDYKVKERNYA
jgi:hypothetical protein